ncbi:MAG: hypothetical protein KN64_02400 [Sulfurovum sp. AS07-7]|jgi:bacterioferritin-associated ferredoxin|nr:MAG: hypothetical protein KN64_02400 [Sulfurovum sp. AS07-7]
MDFNFEDDTEVCTCWSITLEQLKKDILENNLSSIDEITDFNDAGSLCGLCRSIEEDEDCDRVLHLSEILKVILESKNS